MTSLLMPTLAQLAAVGNVGAFVVGCDYEDSHDAEPDNFSETVTWPENLKSQEVLAPMF
jgi:hypothetical protein